MANRYMLITESALDELLMHRVFDGSGLPAESQNRGLYFNDLSEEVTALLTANEPSAPFTALVNLNELRVLTGACNGAFGDVYGRIARVVKAMKLPPIHLPRHWSEYHYKNLISFFALPRGTVEYRWIVDTDGGLRCVRFDVVTTATRQVDLVIHRPTDWPNGLEALGAALSVVRGRMKQVSSTEALVQEVDLKAIGSESVVHSRSFEEWRSQLTSDQMEVLNAPSNKSLRIIGPAGSGKTLALCMKALDVSRQEEGSGQAKKVLVATHSWAMAERVTGILETLNAGRMPESTTVLPLLYLLQVHTGQSGAQSIQLIGDDSKEGRVAAISLIQDVLREDGAILKDKPDLSQWLAEALGAADDSRALADLSLNVYDEFTGVLAAEAVALDDQESVRKYLLATREDWMPPFPSSGDRLVLIQIYRRFLTKLSDRASITTDQFISDAIRVLETFTWRMRRETEGYDFVFVDELQLFDSQERLALELLGRSRVGVPFFTAEDPSQGVFSPLHQRQAMGGVNTSVYLNAVHRFDQSIFELIQFFYQKFPLNTIPLRIDPRKSGASERPVAHLCSMDSQAISRVMAIAGESAETVTGGCRLCVITLGDVDDEIASGLESRSIQVVQLKAFDDVERLSYTKRAAVVAPWQFIGGTQFSNVIVIVAGLNPVNTAFGRLRELTALYLACSRATDRLDIVCGHHVPSVVEEAITAKLLLERRD